MATKSLAASLMSLRCKFKDTDTVELTVIDSNTNDIFVLRWQFRKGLAKKNKAKALCTTPEETADSLLDQLSGDDEIGGNE